MARQRKQRRRPPPPKHGPLNQPTRTHVVMRYEVRRPPGMDGPEWIPRETPPMDEGYAYQLYEGALAEMTGDQTQFPMGPPIRDPYLVRIEMFETQLTKRLEDARRWTEAQATTNESIRAELEQHLAAGGTVELTPEETAADV